MAGGACRGTQLLRGGDWNEIEVVARRDIGCERLMGVPGIGPIFSSAMVAPIGSGDAFTKGRDLGHVRRIRPICNISA